MILKSTGSGNSAPVSLVRKPHEDFKAVDLSGLSSQTHSSNS